MEAKTLFVVLCTMFAFPDWVQNTVLSADDMTARGVDPDYAVNSGAVAPLDPEDAALVNAAFEGDTAPAGDTAPEGGEEKPAPAPAKEDKKTAHVLAGETVAALRERAVRERGVEPTVVSRMSKATLISILTA